MKMTVNIPDNVLRDAMRHTKAKTKREAIIKALEEMNRRYSQAELLKYTGKFESLMTNAEIEAMEAEAGKAGLRLRRARRFGKRESETCRYFQLGEPIHPATPAKNRQIDRSCSTFQITSNEQNRTC